MSPNWPEDRDEVVQHLQRLIQFDTTNPPGNELPAAQYLADVLDREGIASQILESSPGRANLIARLKGNGSERPLVLMSHLDVVPAEAEKWKRPPFSGEIAEGMLWGRGAIDTKNLTAVELVLMLLLKREGATLNRDVVLAATADEEMGGTAGMGWMVEHHPDLVDAEYAINEGGGFGLKVGDKRVYVCQTAEKGVCWMRIRSHGTPGHGSTPKGDNAVVKLAEAVIRLGGARLPLHIIPTVREFVREVAALLPFPQSARLPLVLNPATEKVVGRSLARDPMMGPLVSAMIRNTATPTVLKAGGKVNVIPSVADGGVDGRLIPGQKPEDLFREMRPHLGQEIEIEVEGSSEPVESPYQAPLYDIFRKAVAAEDPEGKVIPFMIPGSTDGRFLAKRGTKVYGFFPMKQDTEESPLTLAHGHNERISLTNLEFASRVLYRAVTELCGVGT